MRCPNACGSSSRRRTHRSSATSTASANRSSNESRGITTATPAVRMIRETRRATGRRSHRGSRRRVPRRGRPRRLERPAAHPWHRSPPVDPAAGATRVVGSRPTCPHPPGRSARPRAHGAARTSCAARRGHPRRGGRARGGLAPGGVGRSPWTALRYRCRCHRSAPVRSVHRTGRFEDVARRRAPADAHPSGLLGAPELGRDLAVAPSVDRAEGQGFALLLRQDADRLPDRPAERLEVDQLLDPVVVLRADARSGIPRRPGPARPPRAGRTARAGARRSRRATQRRRRPRRGTGARGERLGEGLGHELRRGLGIEGSPGEVARNASAWRSNSAPKSSGSPHDRRISSASSSPSPTPPSIVPTGPCRSGPVP